MKHSMIRNSLRFTLILALLSASASLFAQRDTTTISSNQGKIEAMQYEIVVDRKNTVPEAPRTYFSKVGERKEKPEKQNVTYDIQPIEANSPDIIPVMKPIRLKIEELSKINGNYLSGGLGNYWATMLSGSFTTKRSKDKFMGVKFSHESFASGSVDRRNSASTQDRIKLFGVFMRDKLTADVGLEYFYDNGYFYGYQPQFKPENRNDIRQTFNRIGVYGSFFNSEKQKIDYKVSARASHLQDRYRAQEQQVDLSVDTHTDVGENNSVLSIGVDYALMTRRDQIISYASRHIARLRLNYLYPISDEISVEGGLKFVYQTDSVSKPAHVYPFLHAKYRFVPNVELHGQISGDIDRVSLHTLQEENFWIKPNNPIFNTNRTVDIAAWLVGSVKTKIDYEVGFSYAWLKNLYFYQTRRQTDAHPIGGTYVYLNSAQFDVFYDLNSTKRFNAYVGGSFHINSYLKAYLRADVYHYRTAVASAIGDYYGYEPNRRVVDTNAIHRPTYALTARLDFDINKKITGYLAWMASGGMRALDFANPEDAYHPTLTTVRIAPANLIDLRIEYWFSPRISLFLQAKNLLNKKYPIYQNYISRGAQVMGGFCWSF